MEPLSYKKMDFEEFCAASISPYQLEAHERWEDIASEAFQYFEQEGNRVTSVEELAQVCTSVLFVSIRVHFSACSSPTHNICFRNSTWVLLLIPCSKIGSDHQMEN